MFIRAHKSESINLLKKKHLKKLKDTVCNARNDSVYVENHIVKIKIIVEYKYHAQGATFVAPKLFFDGIIQEKYHNEKKKENKSN